MCHQMCQQKENIFNSLTLSCKASKCVSIISQISQGIFSSGCYPSIKHNSLYWWKSESRQYHRYTATVDDISRRFIYLSTRSWLGKKILRLCRSSKLPICATNHLPVLILFDITSCFYSYLSAKWLVNTLKFQNLRTDKQTKS